MTADLMSCEVWNQCGACFEASERQYDQWFKRVGRNRSMWSLVIDDMHEQAYAEALTEDSERDDMADNEIKAQIDKLRKTRPARALDAMTFISDALSDQRTLGAVLSFLRDDLKEEARLLEQAKLRGGTTIMRDRLAVAGWLELFVLQLGRKSEVESTSTQPSEILSPSPELGEHRPSDRGSDAAVLPGPGGRCAVGNVHDGSTLKCPCGLDLTKGVELASAAVFPPSPEKIADGKAIMDYLSGASDTLDALALQPQFPEGAPEYDAYAVELRTELGKFANGEEPYPYSAIVLQDASFTDATAYIGDALAPAEQAAHDTIDRELAHVTADPFVLPADPFAPIPVQTYAPRTPPGGRALTTLDLLTPMDASLLPAHVSFSQLNTVADCGVKFRLQRVEQLPQVPQWANVGGKAFHAAVEAFEALGAPAGEAGSVELLWLKVFNLEIEATEQSSGMPRDTFRASQQGKENYDWWRVEGELMLHRYVAWRAVAGIHQQVLLSPAVVPMLEWETTYDVDGVPFKTILDSVWTDSAEGGLVMGRTAIIRDWKTGSMTPDDRQLCTQAWGLRKAGWQGQILVQFFDARKGTFSEPFDPFARMTWDDVRYFVLSGDAERRVPIPSARPSDFCGGCPVAYACPIMSQRRAAKVAK